MCNSVRVISTNDTENKQQGYTAFNDSFEKSSEAGRLYPALDNVNRIKKIHEIANLVMTYTKTKSSMCGPGEFSLPAPDRVYWSHRAPLEKSPYTQIKFQFKTRSFTPNDADNLAKFLEGQGFDNLDLTSVKGKPRVIIHVPL